MKPNIHPEYVESQIVCACERSITRARPSRTFASASARVCHPFFTGEQKFIDTAGRVEKFTRRFGASKLTKERMAGTKKK